MTVKVLFMSICAALQFTAWPCAALAQTTGGMKGTLLSPNGSVILDLDPQRGTITAVDRNNGRTYSTHVDAVGHYAFAALPPAEYEISVDPQSALYGQMRQPGVRIESGKILQLDLHLPWGMNLGTIGDDPFMLALRMQQDSIRTLGKRMNDRAPRTPDGKPDFSGVWSALPEKQGPGGNVPPMKPRQLAAFQNHFARAMATGEQIDAQSYCLPGSAVPFTLPFPFELVQSATRLVHITEYNTPAHRMIYLDGRKHPDLWNPSWYGHSVGHWERDTLVIESVGFNDKAQGFGVHSEKLTVVERITRPSFGRLVIDIVAQDPEAWTAPNHLTVKATLLAGHEVLEFVCAEGLDDPKLLGGNWQPAR